MGKIFAGLIFVFFHININGFDLLPDFVGYLLIYFGMSEFGLTERRCELFWVSRGIAMAAAVLNAATSVLALLMGGSIRGVLAWLIVLTGFVLNLLTTFRIMRGVGELEHTFDIDLNGAGLEKAWKVMVVGSLVARGISWLEEVLGGYGAGLFRYLALLALLVAFVAMVVYVVYFYRAWKGWERRPAQAD